MHKKNNMSTNLEEINKLIKHQIYMRGQATRVSNEMLEYLDILRKELLAKLDAAPALNNPRHVNAMIREIDVLIAEVYGNYQAGLTDKLMELAEYESRYAIQAASNVGIAKADDIVVLSKTRLNAIVSQDPFDGKILKEWISEQEDSLKRKVRQQIRLGVGAGEGADKIAKRVIAADYKKAKHNAVAMVRTAVNHISTQANSASFQEAGVERFQLSAILDGRTTLICAGLDGDIYRFDDPTAPRPPFHPNCRTTIIPVLGETRFKKKFSEWLNELDEKDQREILGRTRYKLYKGGMSIKEFTDDNQHIIPLSELRRKEQVKNILNKTG